MKKETDYSKQKLELLGLKPSFIQETSEFRKKWKIPKAGFKNNNESENWHERLDKRSNDFELSKHFQEKLKKIFSELQKANKAKERKRIIALKEDMKKLDNENPINIFYSDMQEMMKKYNLSNYYRHPIERYLKFNSFSFVPRDNIRFWFEREKNNKGKRRLYLEIYAETTIEDIRRIWKMIRRYQKSAVGYNEKRKRSKINFKVDMRIYELYQDKHKNREICGIIKKEFGKSILYYEIPGIIKRMKDKISDI